MYVQEGCLAKGLGSRSLARSLSRSTENFSHASQRLALGHKTAKQQLDHPGAVEAAWQDWWEASGYYSCDPKFAMQCRTEDEKFVMVIPPPNVTGSLHLGHALTAAVEDTLTRWHRMKGHATLYVPGTWTRERPYRCVFDGA